MSNTPTQSPASGAANAVSAASEPTLEEQIAYQAQAVRASTLPSTIRIESAILASLRRLAGREGELTCSCCNGTRIGPSNSNFAGHPCPVCR